MTVGSSTNQFIPEDLIGHPTTSDSPDWGLNEHLLVPSSSPVITCLRVEYSRFQGQWLPHHHTKEVQYGSLLHKSGSRNINWSIKGMFRCLKFLEMYYVLDMPFFIFSACIFHNFILKHCYLNLHVDEIEFDQEEGDAEIEANPSRLLQGLPTNN